MSNEKIGFYFNDFGGMFVMKYCETEADAKEMCLNNEDICHWEGEGIYYIEQDHHHCSGDIYYDIWKMSDLDVMDMLAFCSAIKKKFTKEQLIEKGWLAPDEEPIS